MARLEDQNGNLENNAIPWSFFKVDVSGFFVVCTKIARSFM